VADCAYDRIEPPAPAPCGLLYHGSLAARATTSAATLRQLRDSRPETVFLDVNLRPPWWQQAQLEQLLAGADWVKLNGDELALLSGSAATRETGRAFLHHYRLRGLLLTRGAAGAELLLADGECLPVTPVPGVEVVDTVGAGDAFAAVLLLGVLRDWALPVALGRAQQFATAIVGRRGATVADREFYRPFNRQWRLND
jgi:fructokinase